MIWFDVDLIPGRPIVTWSYHIQPLIYVTLLSLNLCDFISLNSRNQFLQTLFAATPLYHKLYSEVPLIWWKSVCFTIYLNFWLHHLSLVSFIKYCFFAFFCKVTDHIPTTVGYAVLKENSKFWGEVKPRAVYRNIKCNLEGHPEGLPW